MRALVLALVVLAPLAAAGSTTDARDVIANQVYPTACPSYTTPAAIGCFDAPDGATSARIAIQDPLGAQPRLWVWLYDGDRLLRSFDMCRDGDVALAGATRAVVALQYDACGGEEWLVAKGTLEVAWG